MSNPAMKEERATAGTMFSDKARSLKHELRTPVNHILGYLALLQETAEDTGDLLLLKQMEEVCAAANEINRAMERALLSSDPAFGEQDLAAMRDAVSPSVQRLIADLAVLQGAGAGVDEASLEDVARIRSAAERLQALLQ